MFEHLNQCDYVSNIKSLRIIDQYSILNQSQLNKFCFDGLQHFELFAEFMESLTFSECEWIGKLKGIAINIHNATQRREKLGNKMLRDVYCAIGDNLESFHKSGSLTMAINGKLNKLEELCVPWNQSSDDLRILLKQNITKLQRINFRECGWNSHGLDKETLQLWLNKIIKTVDHVSFDGLGLDCFDAFDGLEIAKTNTL